ncbi:hypothetical protein JRO89_XS01G0298800 [Xanthoceras sorbifolium]|uniref:Myeloid leukemia factor 1 n=1 Tax=Xanthoceras sorbifolium TaxID=99658 RepID=A0ABQ8IM53_9ROSI|nr:hypothetical protein JRO89_XS01G0298800 [Xanthoceras sorbifolium]
MQREREGRNDLFDMGDRLGGFQGFGSFGFHRSMMPSLFGARDPFDDPFFTRPFGSMFETSTVGQSASYSSTPETIEAKGVIIEELNSDHEGDDKEDNGFGDVKGNSEIHSGSSKEPSVEHPDDDDDVDANGQDQENELYNPHNKVEGTRPQARNCSFQTCKVTYGGVDGAYYTSTRTRRAGSDGAVLEESKEADRTTGQATHRISRGIHDKGHSVTRKLNSKGKVDTMQTLHNLNEDELSGFEEVWKGNVKMHMPDWRDEFDTCGNAGSSCDEQKGKATWGGRLLPSSEQARNFGGTRPNDKARTTATAEKTKNVVRINIE